MTESFFHKKFTLWASFQKDISECIDRSLQDTDFRRNLPESLTTYAREFYTLQNTLFENTILLAQEEALTEEDAKSLLNMSENFAAKAQEDFFQKSGKRHTLEFILALEAAEKSLHTTV